MVSPTVMHIFWILVFVLVVFAIYMFIFRGKDYRSIMGGGPTRLIISEPEYTQVLDGKKKFDVRPVKRPFERIKVGDEILIIRSRPRGDTSEHPKYKVNAKVISVEEFETVEKALKSHVDKVYPGKKLVEAVERYKEFNSGGEKVMLIGFELMDKKPSKKTESYSTVDIDDDYSATLDRDYYPY